MKNIKVEKHIDCDCDTYYEARWVGISKDIIIVGGGATPEEAIAELKLKMNLERAKRNCYQYAESEEIETEEDIRVADKPKPVDLFDKFKSIGEIPCEECIYFHKGCEDFRSDEDCVEKIIRLSLEKVGIKIN